MDPVDRTHEETHYHHSVYFDSNTKRGAQYATAGSLGFLDGDTTIPHRGIVMPPLLLHMVASAPPAMSPPFRNQSSRLPTGPHPSPRKSLSSRILAVSFSNSLRSPPSPLLDPPTFRTCIAPPQSTACNGLRPPWLQSSDQEEPCSFNDCCRITRISSADGIVVVKEVITEMLSVVSALNC